MPQTRTISKNNTTISRNDRGLVVVTLHQTPVVTIDYLGGCITFNNGGYVTATTATRINQVCNEYGLAFGVSRKQGIMYLHNRKLGTIEAFGRSITVNL